MAIVIPVFGKKVEDNFATIARMNNTTLMIAIVFVFLLGAGVGFYSTRLIF